MTNNYFFNHSTVLSVLKLQLYFDYQSLKMCVRMCVCVREMSLCVCFCSTKVRNKKRLTYVMSDT